jgi:hypothetical protein
MLSRMFDTAVSWFCEHEWSRRRDGHRMYLECVRCRTTTCGIQIRETDAPARAPAPARPVNVVQAEAS